MFGVAYKLPKSCHLNKARGWGIDTFQNHAHFLDAILNGATNNVHKLKCDVESSFKE